MSTSNKRPGVYVSEFLTASQTPQSASTSVAAFIGGHHRGPTGPTGATLVSSWTEFVSIYGGFPPTGTTPTELPFSVYQFFSNGGRQAYIVRALGTGGTVATVSLNDRAGTPLPTLKIDAKNAGAWGNALRIDVALRGSLAGGRFDLTVKYGGTTQADVVEQFTDLSMVDTDDRYVEAVINSVTAGSMFITVTDLDSASVAPDDTPVVVSGAALTTGADGAAPSTAQLQEAVTEGTSPLDLVPGLLTVNVPGVSTSAVISSLSTYAQARGDCFVVVDPPVGNTVAQAITYGTAISPTSYLGVYYPWILAGDPSSTSPGATRLQAPGGFVIGKFAETDAIKGVWKSPAGLNVRIGTAVALERKLTNTELDSLNASNINAIRQIPGAGTVIMGARTLDTSSSGRYVNVRRTINYVKDRAKANTQFAIFENNDQPLWNQITSVLDRFLTGLWQSGGLKGGSAAEAFYVKCDSELNTPQVIASGVVKIEIGVALQQPAEFVVIRIGQWEGGAATSEGA